MESSPKGSKTTVSSMFHELTNPSDPAAETVNPPVPSQTRPDPKYHTHLQLVAVPLWTGFPKGLAC